jgi:hypothetical protein
MATLASSLSARLWPGGTPPAGFHQKFHRLIFGSSSSKLSQRDDNAGGVKHFLSVLLRALPRARHFALVEAFAVAVALAFALPTKVRS